jgi:DNA topoisomerase-1
VNDETAPGIRRLGRSRFKYVDPSGRTVSDAATLARIRTLAIPPAWTRVWISPAPNAHIQATGRDARGRKQYRYHADWRRVRDEVKYGRLIAFSQALPQIRQQTDADLRRHGLPREKVLAAVVQLLEKTLIRVGNEEYARDNGSIGLTTMKDGHAKIAAGKVKFEFRGKSGVHHAIALDDRRLARIIKACRDLPGYELFQYLDNKGRRQVIDSADVNAYLREISGHDYSAKDFRTWAGTVLAAQALAAIEAFSSQAQAKRNVIAAIESVAKKLGNTRSVCRKCYIHPAILEGYMDGATIATLRGRAARVAKSGGLSAEESAVVTMIELGLAAQSKRPVSAGRAAAKPHQLRSRAS